MAYRMEGCQFDPMIDSLGSRIWDHSLVTYCCALVPYGAMLGDTRTTRGGLHHPAAVTGTEAALADVIFRASKNGRSLTRPVLEPHSPSALGSDSRYRLESVAVPAVKATSYQLVLQGPGMRMKPNRRTHSPRLTVSSSTHGSAHTSYFSVPVWRVPVPLRRLLPRSLSASPCHSYTVTEGT